MPQSAAGCYPEYAMARPDLAFDFTGEDYLHHFCDQCEGFVGHNKCGGDFSVPMARGGGQRKRKSHMGR
jgi:hypothetical protein